MKRSILAGIAGFIAWVLVVSLLDRGLRMWIAGYAEAEPKMTFTLLMMIARLAMAAVTSLVAGAVTAAVNPSSSGPGWGVGIVLLVLFLPLHIQIWSTFPIWYHLTFLLTLAPLVALGSWLVRRRSPRLSAPDLQHAA